jgi:hypothetical protein
MPESSAMMGTSVQEMAAHGAACSKELSVETPFWMSGKHVTMGIPGVMTAVAAPVRRKHRAVVLLQPRAAVMGRSIAASNVMKAFSTGIRPAPVVRLVVSPRVAMASLITVRENVAMMAILSRETDARHPARMKQRSSLRS